MNQAFVPLVCRSGFSLMRGTARVGELVRAARALGYTRLALTDRDNLYGLPEFLKHCAREGIAPLVGAELTAPPPVPGPVAAAAAARVVCLVENATGYSNLCQLISWRHQAREFQAAGGLPGAVAQHREGLTVLADDPALLEQLHEHGVTVAALQPIGPRGNFVPLQRTARRLQAPLVAAPDSYFLQPQDHATHRVLRAIALNTVLSRLPATEVAAPDAWLAAPQEYARRFAICPEAVTATQAIAERCVFRGPDRRTIFPAWKDPQGRSTAQVLRAAAYAGAHWRYAGAGGQELPETVVDRLEHELRCIEGKGFADYFLYVKDIVRRSPRICGRGSGAASIVAYCLGITNVCPLKFNLYFERFLNPQRVDPPDIDVDFAWDERDGVQAEVLAAYPGQVAMVCNHVLFQPRMAVREVAKVFGLPAMEIDRVTRKLPWHWREDAAGNREPETGIVRLNEGGPSAATGGGEASGTTATWEQQFRRLPQMRSVQFPKPWPEILGIARGLLKLPRHLSVHSGGVVITPRPVREYVPVETAAKGVPIVHWEKDGTEEMGLVKIDLLGNRSLAVIRDAIANLRANGIPFDEFYWQPEDDPLTQALVARGDTMGCFYVESPATRLLQARTRKGDYEHLVIHSSIIRPAANEYIREYIRRLRGGAWEPLHPLLTDVLAESYGIMVYQEHVALTAIVLAGFSHYDADQLRKVLSKKDQEQALADYCAQFFAGARRKGLDDERIDAIWRMILSFSGYSFCKPHSASYARVSFQAAYLKAHHPAEFLAGVLSNGGGFYSIFAYVSEALRRGLTVLPPDVNRSNWRWTGQGQTLRAGLVAVKHLSTATAERIVAERQSRPYRDFRDFLERVRPDENEARALIQCGFFDSLKSVAAAFTHVDLLWQLAAWQAPTVERKRAADCAPGLFDLTPAALPPAVAGTGADTEPLPPVLPPTTPLERLRQQFEVLGFLCDHHPLRLFTAELAEKKRVLARDLSNHVGRRIMLAGWSITGKVVATRAGEAMEFLTFEDETGLIETTLFPRTYARYCHMLDTAGPFFITGIVEEDFGVCTLTVDRLALIRPQKHLHWREHAEAKSTRDTLAAAPVPAEAALPLPPNRETA